MMVFGNLNPLTSPTALPQILQVTSSDTSVDEHSYHPLLILYLYGTFVSSQKEKKSMTRLFDFLQQL
jgi:hypothetical protein